MTAWDHLLASSTLPAGTAWQLLTSPRAGTVVSDGIAVDLSTPQFDLELSVDDLAVEVADGSVVAEVDDASIEVQLGTDAAETEICT